MIVFNTLKKAQHYVRWREKNSDYQRSHGFEWESESTFIDGELVLVSASGDGCGCGCDMYRYHRVSVLGRIRAHDLESARADKLGKILSGK